MNKMHKIQELQIELDVGGKFFTTSITTLTKEPDSMLGRMFSGRFPIKKNEKGRVFIDRDGAWFKLILEYLRDGQFYIPEDEKEVKKLQREVDYYQLDGMTHAINSHDNNNNNNNSNNN